MSINQLSCSPRGRTLIEQIDVNTTNPNDPAAYREVRTTTLTGSLVDKGPHRHFMAKEIFEQPEVIGNTLAGVINPVTQVAQLPKLPFDFAKRMKSQTIRK